MRSLKNFLALLLVLLIALLAFSPFFILNISLPDEAWLIGAAREMNEKFRLIPRLDGAVLGNQNPVIVMLYSLTGGDLLVSRISTAMLGLILAGSVLGFSWRLRGRKTGILAALVAVTCLGTVSLFGRSNPDALPVMMSASAFMLFSAVYLRGMKKALYLPAYMMAAVSVITGGPVYLFFFALSAVMLVLLDLSPGELLRVKTVAAAAFLAGGLVAFYAVFRIGGGKSYVAGVMSQGADIGFFGSLWLFVRNSLPWSFFLIPAWAYSARPSDYNAWRELLPAKIAVIASFLVLWLSGRCSDYFSVIAMPFAAVIIASWLSGCGEEKGAKDYLGVSAAVLAGAAVPLMPAAYVLRFPLRSLHPAAADIVILLCLLSIGACLVLAALRMRYMTVVAVTAAAVILVSWLRPFYEARLNNPSEMIAHCSNIRPLLVYEDDLVMRGELAPVLPIVVPRCFVPVGGAAYIAASTDDRGRFMKDIGKRMSAELQMSETLDRDYLLIKIKP